MNTIAILCASLLTFASPVVAPDLAQQTCETVGELADAGGVPGELAIALAYYETRFDRERVSVAGARDVLQVLPVYWCDRGQRQLIYPGDCGGDDGYLWAGLRALRWFYVRSRRRWSPTVWRYVGGAVSGNKRHHRQITRLAERLRRQARCGCSVM